MTDQTTQKFDRCLTDAATADALRNAPPGYLSPDVLSELPKDTPLLLGFSGGVDSSVLLFLTAAYARETGAPLRLVHLHHGIRGDEADRDAAFAKEAARLYGLPISVIYRDVPRIARESGEGIEAAARRARYEVFSELMQEYRIPLLLTAHNADDNLETVLFHLLRGSGLSGLTGIPPKRELPYGTVVRPLLRTSRADIEAFRERYAIPAIFDSTNDDVSYTRNRIRREILPLLREISPAPERAASRMTASLLRDKDLLDRLAEKTLERARTSNGLDRSLLLEEADAVVLRVLFLYWKESCGGLDSYESVHLDALLRFSRTGRDGSHLSLPGSTAAIVGRYLSIQAGPPEENATPPDFSVRIALGENRIDALSVSLTLMPDEQATYFSVEAREIPKNIYNSATQIHIPFDTIKSVYEKDELIARPRHPGDRILLRGMHRSLRTLLNEAGFPKEARKRLLVVTAGNEILWVPGLAVSDLVSTQKTGTGELVLSLSRFPF